MLITVALKSVLSLASEEPVRGAIRPPGSPYRPSANHYICIYQTLVSHMYFSDFRVSCSPKNLLTMTVNSVESALPLIVFFFKLKTVFIVTFSCYIWKNDLLKVSMSLLNWYQMIFHCQKCIEISKVFIYCFHNWWLKYKLYLKKHHVNRKNTYRWLTY